VIAVSKWSGKQALLEALRYTVAGDSLFFEVVHYVNSNGQDLLHLEDSI
jgi:hypothetical protein